MTIMIYIYIYIPTHSLQMIITTNQIRMDVTDPFVCLGGTRIFISPRVYHASSVGVRKVVCRRTYICESSHRALRVWYIPKYITRARVCVCVCVCLNSYASRLCVIWTYYMGSTLIFNFCCLFKCWFLEILIIYL